MLQDPKHGRWSLRLSAGFDPATGKRRQVNGRTFDTKREAQTERNKAAALIDRGKVPTVDRTTYAEYLPRWLDRRARMGSGRRGPLRGSTLENYRRYVDQDIAPSALGAMQVRQIRRGHVQALIDQLVDAGRGAVSVRRIVAVVQGSLRAAVKDELLEDFHASHLDLPLVDDHEFVPWEAEQVGHFLDVAGEHRLGALFEFAIFTGLRRGEIVALTWDEVDLAAEQPELRIRRSKTNAGRRRVALDDRTVGALMAWQIAQVAEREAWGPAYDDSGRVFTMEDGRPLKPQYVHPPVRAAARARRPAEDDPARHPPPAGLAAARGGHSPGRGVQPPRSLLGVGHRRHLQPPPALHRARRRQQRGRAGAPRKVPAHTARTRG